VSLTGSSLDRIREHYREEVEMASIYLAQPNHRSRGHGSDRHPPPQLQQFPRGIHDATRRVANPTHPAAHTIQLNEIKPHQMASCRMPPSPGEKTQ